jgi:hypothetical protein
VTTLKTSLEKIMGAFAAKKSGGGNPPPLKA